VSYAKSAAICRAALARSPLEMKVYSKGGLMWMFGKRMFSPATVKYLIDRGEAIQIGNVVRKS
jgi:hypothetical protein